jgi:hypothetical protein
MTDKYTIMVFEDEVFGIEKIKELFKTKGCVFIGALPEKAFDKFNEFHDELLEDNL